MPKTRRTDYLDNLKRPAGFSQTVSDILRRTLNLERAQVVFSPTAPTPQKRAVKTAPTPPATGTIPFLDSTFHWVYYNPDSDTWTLGADFPNAKTPFAVYGSTWIAQGNTGDANRTSDNGATTQNFLYPDNSAIPQPNFPNMAFDGNGRLWGVFKNGDTYDRSIWYSDDLGDNWTHSRTIPLPGGATTLTLYRIGVSADGQNIAVTEEGDDQVSRVEVSTNGGSSWTQSSDISVSDDISGWDYMEPIWLGNNLIVCVATFVGSAYEVWKLRRSTDGGSSWATVYSIADATPYNGDNGERNTLAMADGSGIVFVNDGSGNWGILRSTDEGATWDFLAITPNDIARKLYAIGTTLYFLELPVTGFYSLANAATASDGTLTALTDIP